MTTTLIIGAPQAAMPGGAQAGIDIEQLFRAHRHHLFRFVQRYVRNPEDADDVVQNTFIEAIRCAERFAGLSKPSTWLFGIALNLARSQLRRHGGNLCDALDDGLIEQIADTHADPARLVEMRQIAARVETVLNGFPAGIRQTFEAVLEGDSTYEEAAALLSIPVGTVRSRVSRVRSAVRAGWQG